MYSHFGYNLKATDMQAAVGCAQLKKFPSFVEKRRHNFAYLKELLSDCADNGVQTRMLFSGNLIKHPCFDDIRGTEAYRVVGGLEQTDRIMTSTFWVGVYPGMTDEKIEYMAKVIHEALEG